MGIEERTGDQLFVEYGINGLTLCVNGSDGTVTSTGGGTYAGGTGQFEGARGSFEVRATGRYLATGVKDGVFGGFGQYTGRSTGELILPRTRPAPYARAPSTSAPAGASATQACRGRVGPSDRLGGHLPRTLSLVFLSSKHHVLDLPNRVGRGHVWP